jgi:UDP-N-acetylglucosamine--N-acetylmuramyl-(pentapeptide) pyrophosphoryl-undecaprenol N-acetylglucosamine transferase
MAAALHIVLGGGGTAGHLTPGLAVAEELSALLPGVRITLAGRGKPVERRLAAQSGLDFRAVPCRPAPRRLRELLGSLACNLAGRRAARRFLEQQRVAAVVGLGGYASVPTALAAARLGVPLVLLEQNAVAGLATRWLAPSARAACLAFESARASLAGRCPVYVTGNPIRRGFRGPALPGRPARPQLLVLGGSGGSHCLNHGVPLALARLGDRLAGWEILHQAGPSEAPATRALYDRLRVAATVADFLDDMPTALAGATLAVSRAGGSTLAEMAACGVPAVLVPFARAARDHQRRNAEVFAAAGGAVVVDEEIGPGSLADRLAAALAGLVADHAGRQRMSAAMGRLARPGAAESVAWLVRSLALECQRPAARRAAV